MIFSPNILIRRKFYKPSSSTFVLPYLDIDQARNKLFTMKKGWYQGSVLSADEYCYPNMNSSDHPTC